MPDHTAAAMLAAAMRDELAAMRRILRATAEALHLPTGDDLDLDAIPVNAGMAHDAARNLRDQFDRCNTERQRLQADLADLAARAEAAEAEADRLRRANKTIIFEDNNVRAQLGRAREAVLASDWPALWDALDIPATERLPAVHAPLDTAPGFTAGQPLTEQEIRSWALDAASRIGAAAGHDGVIDIDEVIDIAGRFADWIRDGDYEPDPVAPDA